MLRFIFNFLALGTTIAFLDVSIAEAKPKKEICYYPSRSGEVRQASSLDNVPREARAQARCVPAEQNNYLAKPEDISLSGNQREENINTSLGKVQLRWPRKVEGLFGRTPLRATTEAANTVARALKNPSFPSFMQKLDLPWKIVFMDESLPEGQIPTSLVTNCHPGWMTPPANIYLVSQRIAGGCGGPRSSASVADSTLAEVLVHEMGHAVEYYLLRQKAPMDRVRAEGFATWFERFAGQYSSVLDTKEISRKQFRAAKAAIARSPNSFNFQGSFEDYSRASMTFSAISGPRGLQGLVDVYRAMSEKGLPLHSAISSELNWDERRLSREIEDLLRQY